VRDGWQTKTLGEVCEFQRGLTYSKGDEVDLSGNVVLRAMNIDLASHRLDFSDLKYISDEVVIPESKKVRRGSLLVCTASGSKSHLGKIAYIDDDYGYAFGGFMGMLVPSSELVPTYLFYVMTSGAYEDFIAALADGMNINNLKYDVLKKFRVLYPSLPEQKRIVGILDEAFEGIATAKANAEKNHEHACALFKRAGDSLVFGNGHYRRRSHAAAESADRSAVHHHSKRDEGHGRDRLLGDLHGATRVLRGPEGQQEASEG
jgi:type I restriction enzyme S subunit